MLVAVDVCFYSFIFRKIKDNKQNSWKLYSKSILPQIEVTENPVCNYSQCKI